MKLNSREYVANCVHMEGASTSKKRRREVRQRKESYTGNNTPFQNRYSKYNATRIMWTIVDIFRKLAPPATSIDMSNNSAPVKTLKKFFFQTAKRTCSF